MRLNDQLEQILRIGSDENVSARIKELRTANGWSLEDLAKKLAEPAIDHPLNSSSLWKIESGSTRRRVSLREALAFAKVFNVDVDELYMTEGQRAQREVASSAADALSALAAVHQAWGAYIQQVNYAQVILERAEDRAAAVAELRAMQSALQRKEQKKAIAFWRQSAKHRIERGEKVPEMMMKDEELLETETFARFMRILIEQPVNSAVDDILAEDLVAADALRPGQPRTFKSSGNGAGL